jgi:hypothetical protein
MKCPNCEHPNTKVCPENETLRTCLSCGFVFCNLNVDRFDYRNFIKEQLRIKKRSIHALALAAGLRSRRTLYKYLEGSNITVTTLTEILEALEKLPFAKNKK